jgi:hypothetical protein
MLRRTSPRHAAAPTRRSSAARFGPLAVAAIGVLTLVPAMVAGAAQAPVPLGAAQSFAVLAGAGITNTGPTTINGDVGTFPTTSQTGFGTVTQTGTNHGGDEVTQQAKTDLTTAYNTAAGATPTTAVATELGGLTLTPGVYGSPTLGITGTLTLNTLGNPNAVFVFKAGSTLITESSSKVIVLGGATACNVFWQVGSSATLGTDSTLVGSVLADISITADTRAVIQGRLLASTGAVTLDTNTITRPTCAPPTTTTTTPPTTTTTETPTTTTTPVETPGTTPAPPIDAGAVPVVVPFAGPTIGGGSPALGEVPFSGTTSGPGGGATPGRGLTNTAGPGSGISLTGQGAPPARPDLPATGSNAITPLLGLSLIAGGLAMTAFSRARRVQV